MAEEQREEAGRFAIHPALLDSALHAACSRARRRGGKPTTALRLARLRVFRLPSRCESESRPGRSPCADVQRCAGGQVDCTRPPDRAGQLAGQRQGARSARSSCHCRFRPPCPRLMRGRRDASLQAVRFRPRGLERYDSPATEAPSAILVDARHLRVGTREPVEASHAFAAEALEAIQALPGRRGATPPRASSSSPRAPWSPATESPDLPAATLSGLLRSALRAPRPLCPDRQRRRRGLD